MPTDQSYYGDENVTTDNKSLRERLRELYEPTDFVRVKNIDSQPLRYQFARPTDEEVVQPSALQKEIYRKNPPVVVTMQPGETKLCPAYEADLMIENLIKQVMASKVSKDVQDGKLDRGAVVNWSNQHSQNELISQILLGKEDLVNQLNKTEEVPEESDVASKTKDRDK